MFFRLIIDFVNTSDPYDWKGYFLAVSLLAVSILRSLTMQLNFKYGAILGMRIRTVVITAVYRKVCRRQSQTKSGHNLMLC